MVVMIMVLKSFRMPHSGSKICVDYQITNYKRSSMSNP